MSRKSLLYYYASGAFRDRFLWDGFTMSVPAQPSSPLTFRFWCNISLSFIAAEYQNTAEIQRWDNTTDPSIRLFTPATDSIIGWNGGTESDYTYTVSETRTGASDPATGYFSDGAHVGTDVGSASCQLNCSTLGSPARWELTIASTHTPSGKTRTGVLIFEFS